MIAAASMALRRRWLNLVRPENGGPRSRNVLLGVAANKGYGAIAEPLLQLMLAEGSLVMRGERRAAAYGLPKMRR